MRAPRTKHLHRCSSCQAEVTTYDESGTAIVYHRCPKLSTRSGLVRFFVVTEEVTSP